MQFRHGDIILGNCFPQALVHTVHSTRAFGTCACGKPFPKIVPMAKLDIFSRFIPFYSIAIYSILF